MAKAVAFRKRASRVERMEKWLPGPWVMEMMVRRLCGKRRVWIRSVDESAWVVVKRGPRGRLRGRRR